MGIMIQKLLFRLRQLLLPGHASQLAVVIVITLYVILHAAYSIAFPIFESWDEVHHYDYIRYLVERRRFPVQPPDGPPTEYHQPPAYYIATALLTVYLPPDEYRPEANEAFAQPYWYHHNKNRYIHPRTVEGWPWRGTTFNTHIMRLTGILWGVLALILTYYLARRVQPEGPDSEWVPPAAVALTGLNPTFIYIMSSINNEIMSVVIGAALSLTLVDTALKGLSWRRAVIVGLLLGLAALTKWTMAPFAAVALSAVLVSHVMWQRPLSQTVKLGLAAAVTLLVAGWWYARNLILYGDLTGVRVMCEAWDACSRASGLRWSPAQFWDAYTGYWGTFGPWGSIRLPTWLYAVMGLVIIVGLIGLALRWLEEKTSAETKRQIFVLGSICLGFIASTLVAAQQSNFGLQPRYLFGAHAAASVLLSLGWWHLVQGWQFPGWMNMGWSSAAGALALVSLVGYILPAYAQPDIVTSSADLEYVTSYDVQMGSFARLIGVSIPAHATPGSLIWIRTCWETLDRPDKSYWQFVHIVGGIDTKLTGIDSLPGRGSYPTVDWQPGTAHCTDWPLEIPPDSLPGQYSVQTGLYERKTLERVNAFFAGGPSFNPPIIGTLVVDAQPADLPASAQDVNVDFGGIIRLRGFEIVPQPANPGDTLTVTLFWEALTPPSQSYTVFVHLLQTGDSVPFAQADGIPRGGLYPTSLWIANTLIRDPHTIILPSDLPSGSYELHVGLYDLGTGQRLAGPEPDFSVILPVELIQN